MLKTFFTSKQMVRFYWNTLTAFLGIVAVYLTGVNWLYAPLVVAIINGITKELNNKYRAK